MAVNRSGTLVFSAVAVFAVSGAILLPGCATPSRPGIRWTSAPTAASDHPAAIDMTYRRAHPPHYPVSGVAAHHHGTVVLDVFVDPRNQVTNVEVAKSSGFPELDSAAAAAAVNWRFVAAVKGGKPVASVVRVPVRFWMKPSAGARAAAPSAPRG